LLQHLSKRADDKSIKVGLQANMDGHRGDVVSLIFDDEGDILMSGARDNDIKVWDTKEFKEIRQVNNKDNAHRGDVRRLLILNEGQFLLSAGLDGNIKLWKLAPKKISGEGLGGWGHARFGGLSGYANRRMHGLSWIVERVTCHHPHSTRIPTHPLTHHPF